MVAAVAVVVVPALQQAPVDRAASPNMPAALAVAMVATPQVIVADRLGQNPPRVRRDRDALPHARQAGQQNRTRDSRVRVFYFR